MSNANPTLAGPPGEGRRGRCNREGVSMALSWPESGRHLWRWARRSGRPDGGMLSSSLDPHRIQGSWCSGLQWAVLSLPGQQATPEWTPQRMCLCSWGQNPSLPEQGAPTNRPCVLRHLVTVPAATPPSSTDRRQRQPPTAVPVCAQIPVGAHGTGAQSAVTAVLRVWHPQHRSRPAFLCSQASAP